MDADGRADFLQGAGNDLADFPRQGAAVGVAQHDPVRARVLRRLQHRQRVFGIVFEPVEEMLRVENDFQPAALQKRDGFADHRQILFQRRLQRGVHVEVPRLAYQRGRFGAGIQKSEQIRVLLADGVLAAGAAERDELGPQVQIPRPAEKLGVFHVAARNAAFNIMNAQGVQFFGDFDLVLYGQADPFPLGSVPQRRVVDADGS